MLDRFTRQDGKSAATFAGFIPVKENAVALKPKKLGIDDFAYLQVSRRRNSHFSSPSANFGDGVDVSDRSDEVTLSKHRSRGKSQVSTASYFLVHPRLSMSPVNPYGDGGTDVWGC